MPLTTSLFVSLLLLLPGLTGLAVWNFQGLKDNARRPELPLAAVNSLFVTIAASLVVHTIAALAVHIVIGAAAAWTRSGFVPAVPTLHNPYPVALNLLVGKVDTGAATDIYGLLCLILVECVIVARIILSPGVGLAMRGLDLRGVGWAHTHFLEPIQHGYTPIAFVMLKAVDEGRGIGYSGPIADLRLDSDGDVKSISLGQPRRFIYQLKDAAKPGLLDRLRARPGDRAALEIEDEKWVGGMIHLSAEQIDNIVIHSPPDEEVEAQSDAPTSDVNQAGVAVNETDDAMRGPV